MFWGENKGKWKATSHRESNPGHLACVTSTLPLNHNNHQPSQSSIYTAQAVDFYANRFASCLTSNWCLGGGGLACDIILLNRNILITCLLELLNLFVGKAQCYSHDYSWDVLGSGVYLFTVSVVFWQSGVNLIMTAWHKLICELPHNANCCSGDIPGDVPPAKAIYY